MNHEKDDRPKIGITEIIKDKLYYVNHPFYYPSGMPFHIRIFKDIDKYLITDEGDMIEQLRYADPDEKALKHPIFRQYRRNIFKDQDIFLHPDNYGVSKEIKFEDLSDLFDLQQHVHLYLQAIIKVVAAHEILLFTLEKKKK